MNGEDDDEGGFLDEDEQDDTTVDNQPDDDTEASDPDAIAFDIVSAGLLPSDRVQDGLEVTWGLVAVATGLSNSNELVLHGTITRNSNGTTSYNPAPNNALLFVGGGQNIRTTINNFAGDLSKDSPEAFYLSEHDVDATISIDGFGNFSVRSTLNGNGSGTRNAEGTLDGGLNFNFSQTQDVNTDFGTGTLDQTANESRQGRVTGPNGLSISFEHTSTYRAVFFDDFAESFTSTLSIEGTADGSRWQMNNGNIRRTFRNGFAVENDFWQGTEGLLTRDGEPFAELGVEIKARSIDLVVQTADTTRVLTSHER